MLIIRSINPQTERELLEVAYLWRPGKPRKNRMPFDQFAADYPNQVVMGLFNGDLIAVYFFHQIGETEYQAHFSADRKADRSAVLAGAKQLVEWFQQNGLQMSAFVHKRNTALRRFVESAGLMYQKDSSCHLTQKGANLTPNAETICEYRS